MRTFELPADHTPRHWGQIHGEEFREEIRELGAIRLELTTEIGGFKSERAVLEVAEDHMPALKEWDGALHDEVLGIAEGAGCSPGLVVVVNHYTDLRDLGPAMRRGEVRGEGECSALYARTEEGALLGQTWDMHASAMDYVLMLRIPRHKTPTGPAPAAWLMSLTGCVGMCGLNAAGLGAVINNLRSRDARVGAVWPALVRRVLRERSVAGGRRVLETSPIGSGHHYMVASHSDVLAVETSGTKQRVVYEGDAPAYVHTNHCLNEEVGELSEVAPTSTSYPRFEALSAGIAERAIRSREDMWQRLGDAELGICYDHSSPDNPHGFATCSGVVMNLDRRDMWGRAGALCAGEPEEFGFDEEDVHL